MTDRILSTVSNKVANFFMKQRASGLEDLESYGYAYFDANKDVLASGMLCEMNIGAVASFRYKCK